MLEIYWLQAWQRGMRPARRIRNPVTMDDPARRHQQLQAELSQIWGAPRLPDSPSIRMDVWKGEVIASTEEELLSRIQR
jgi:hypothetical protein